MSQRTFARSSLPACRRRHLLLAGVSTVVIAVTLPASAGTFVFNDGDNEASAISMTGVNTFTAGTGVTATVSGIVSGTGSFSKGGAGKLIVSGNNPYSGGTDVSEGTLSLMHNNALGTGAVTFNGGSLAFYAPTAMTLANDIVVNSSASLDTAQHTTLSGVLSGAKSLTKVGGGTLTLSGANTFAGGLFVRNGTVRVENDNALGAGAVTFGGEWGSSLALSYANGVMVSNNVILNANTDFRVDSGTATQAGTIGRGYGMVFMGKSGAGELVVTGSMNVGMGFSIDQGQLTAGAANVLDAGGRYTPTGSGRLKLAANQQISSLTGDGTVDLASSRLTIASDSLGFNFRGSLVGEADAHLVKAGTSGLFLEGNGLGYNGRMSLQGGTLAVNGNFAGTPVYVTGGRLRGTGQLGDVFIDGGTLSGTDGTTLSMRDLSLTASSIVEANLGTEKTAALFNVAGDIVLDGRLNVVNKGGFGPGVYRLFSYGGALDDRGLEIGTVPNGYDADNLAVQTAVGGQVNLVADDPDYGPVLFWDGDKAANWDNNKVDGGSGRWKTGGRAFTDANGILNGPMNPRPGFAVFGGTAGNVLVDSGTGQVQATGMQFASDGYILSGDMLELVAGDAFIRVGDGTTAGANYTATIYNNMDGAGRLVKTDLGTLVLEGENTYWGGTEVRQGTLQVDGDIGDVVVGAEGRLGGNGTVGTAVVSGTLTGGKSMGVLSVDGDLTMQEGSTLEVKADAAGNSDRVDVTGIAYLNGGRVATLASGGDYADQTSYTILSAEGGIDGTFAGVTSNLAFLDAALSYSEKDVKLALTRNGTTFENVGNTHNQIVTGGGVEGLGAGNALYDRVLTLSAADARFAFDEMSGEIHSSAKGVLLNDSRFVRDAADARVRSAFGAVGAAALPVLAYGEGGSELAPAATDRFAMWSEAFGSWGSSRGDGNAASLDDSTGGLLIGGDAAFGEAWRAGLVAGYSQTTFDVDDRSSSGNSDNYHLGLYGGGQWGAVGLRGGAAYSWSRIDIGRSVAFPGFEDSLSAKYDEGTAQIFAEVGYRIDTAAASFEPFANLAYVSLHTDGFNEHGGAAALKATGTTTDATFTTLGIRAQSNFVLGGVAATARGTLGWRHASGDVKPLASVAFAGGEAFTVVGTPIARDVAVIEAGLDFAVSSQATLGLSYAGQLASHASDNGFKADLSIRF